MMNVQQSHVSKQARRQAVFCPPPFYASQQYYYYQLYQIQHACFANIPSAGRNNSDTKIKQINDSHLSKQFPQLCNDSNQEPCMKMNDISIDYTRSPFFDIYQRNSMCNC